MAALFYKAYEHTQKNLYRRRHLSTLNRTGQRHLLPLVRRHWYIKECDKATCPTPLEGLKKRNPGFLFLCQTIVSVSFTKERWTQKLSGTLLNYYYYFFNWTFLGLRSGPLDFFWARVYPEGLFLGRTNRLIRTSPSLIYLSTPPWAYSNTFLSL